MQTRLSSPDLTIAKPNGFDPKQLRSTIDRAMLRDRGPLRSRLRRLDEAARKGGDMAADGAKLAADIARSVEAAEQRRARLPRISYPEELPISGKREDIAAAIRDAPGRDRLRRDRFGQDHAAAEDLPRARPRRRRA